MIVTIQDENGLTATEHEKKEQYERVQALKEQRESQKPIAEQSSVSLSTVIRNYKTQ